MNVYEANSIIIPEGSVKRILDMNDVILWEKKYVDTTPFYIEDLSGEENIITIKRDVVDEEPGDYHPSIDKSFDGVNWDTLGRIRNTGFSITIPANSRLYLRFTPGVRGGTLWCLPPSAGSTFRVVYNHINGSKRHKVGGNIASLDVSLAFNGEIPRLLCFGRLFYNDVNLVDASDLKLNYPDTQLDMSCCWEMFKGCTSLVSAPILPANTLKWCCYQDMFSGCTSLLTAPALPAITLDQSCCRGMFSYCTSLLTAPAILPAATLANYCYMGMFYGCTALTNTPELPATTLTSSCYQEMFSGCTSLNYIKCLATDISASGCLYKWTNSVATTGTFYKKSGVTYPSGISGIPDGWTVVDL